LAQPGPLEEVRPEPIVRESTKRGLRMTVASDLIT